MDTELELVGNMPARCTALATPSQSFGMTCWEREEDRASERASRKKKSNGISACRVSVAAGGRAGAIRHDSRKKKKVVVVGSNHDGTRVSDQRAVVRQAVVAGVWASTPGT